MAIKHISVELRIAWWFKYLYLPMLTGTYSIASAINPNISINQVKLEKWFKRAVKIKIKVTHVQKN